MLGNLGNYLDIIGKSALFKGIEPQNMENMLKCLNPLIRHYKRNDMITLAGEPFTGIGLLLEGEASVSKESPSGNRVVLNLIHSGDMFGEMIAFSDQSVWPATVQAVEDATALFIPREKIIGECQRLCPWHRAIIQNMLRIVSNRAIMLSKRLEILTIKSMRGKLCALFLDQYQREGRATFTLSMNRNQLAEFLNVSRPSMSRELGRMKEEGLIDYHLSSIRLLDIPALKRALDEEG